LIKSWYFTGGTSQLKCGGIKAGSASASFLIFQEYNLVNYGTINYASGATSIGVT
jgi:hypothetical protein